MSAFSIDGKRACHYARNFNGRSRPGLNVNFLPTQSAHAHITALMIGAVPAALASTISSVEVLKSLKLRPAFVLKNDSARKVYKTHPSKPHPP